MNEAISAQIARGEITAITLDTSIFKSNGLAMETGLLQQLGQFRDSDVSLVIANTVANEVRRHLAANAEEAASGLQASLRETARHQALPPDVQQQLDDLARGAIAAVGGRARQRFDDWAGRTGAVILDEDEFASIGEVMRRYESGEPPFGTTGKKKHEFPDAVAVLTLEGWAAKQGTKILTVTGDGDWKRYGGQSERLVVIDDLAHALAAFQRRAEAREAASRLARSIGEGDPYGLVDALQAALQHQADRIDYYVEADSQFAVEEDGIDAEYEGVDLPDPAAAATTFETISYDDGEVVIKLSASTLARVDVHFVFDKWDSVDNEYLSMGSADLSTEEQVEFEALVTLTGEIPGDMTIADVEILPRQIYVHFNEIEPDWMSNRDDHDADDDRR